MEKINFSGGEPFIYKRGDFVGELVRYCKLELGIQSVTIVCNGSLVTERWFKSYGTQAVVFRLIKTVGMIAGSMRSQI